MNADAYRVLIVDDEEMIRHLVVSVLSKQGHICETARDGFEALDKIRRNVYDAVITDMEMPKMNGITLVKALLYEFRELPIMVMTGFTRDYSVRAVFALGAKDFVKKPFSIQEFLLRFSKMMREQEFRSKSIPPKYVDLSNLSQAF